MISCVGMSDDNYRLVSLDELMVGAQPCDAVEQVRREAAVAEYPFPAGHASYLRDARAWNELADKPL